MEKTNKFLEKYQNFKSDRTGNSELKIEFEELKALIFSEDEKERLKDNIFLQLDALAHFILSNNNNSDS